MTLPPRQPLAMPTQAFGQAPPPRQPSPKPERAVPLYRLLAFLPVLITTALLMIVVADLFSAGGIGWIEAVLMALMGTSFVWIALSVSTAILGALGPARPAKAPAARPMEIAVLMPIYHEDPYAVFGNALAMLHDLAAKPGGHRFSLFVLSDTNGTAAVGDEMRLASRLAAHAPAQIPVYYRNRADNTDRKTGNIADWVRGWGAGYEAMLVLDADSLMTAEAITALADIMSAEDGLGLVQSQPMLYNARGLFARIQQFGSHVYGPNLARGLALWSGNTANFWGHNALIRTAAFAQSAGLPKLRRWGRAGRLILSHDFVEAALLRRNGWAVRFEPSIAGSYEEAPESLYDFVQRDRRWCHGNLQHLRLMTIRGLHWLSRVHFLSGAFSYLLSPAWFLLLTIWVLLGRDTAANPISYFSAVNPLYPRWPEPQAMHAFWVLLCIYAMLLLPKVLGAVQVLAHPSRVRAHGGHRRFALSFGAELALSIIYAPLLMVQQTRAVLRAVLGVRQDWTPRRTAKGGLAWRALLRLHGWETVLGVGLWAGIITGFVSPWLVPVALSLACAVPLSALSSHAGGRRWLPAPTPLAQAAIVRSAQSWQAFLHDGDDPGARSAA